MSKFVRVRTELRELSLIKRALDDLKIGYEENARYVHRWTGRADQAEVLVTHGGAQFGLREGDGGVYEVMADDMQLRSVRGIVDRVQQRYAYHRVLAETEQAGFALVEEEVGQDNVIRLTVRRWN